MSTKVPNCSSSAGVHRGFTLELVHMEVEAEGQESEVKDRKDGEECEVEVYQWRRIQMGKETSEASRRMIELAQGRKRKTSFV